MHAIHLHHNTHLQILQGLLVEEQSQWGYSHATSIAVGTRAIELLPGWLEYVVQVRVPQSFQHRYDIALIAPLWLTGILLCKSDRRMTYIIGRILLILIIVIVIKKTRW